MQMMEAVMATMVSFTELLQLKVDLGVSQSFSY